MWSSSVSSLLPIVLTLVNTTTIILLLLGYDITWRRLHCSWTRIFIALMNIIVIGSLALTHSTKLVLSNLVYFRILANVLFKLFKYVSILTSWTLYQTFFYTFIKMTSAYSTSVTLLLVSLRLHNIANNGNGTIPL